MEVARSARGLPIAFARSARFASCLLAPSAALLALLAVSCRGTELCKLRLAVLLKASLLDTCSDLNSISLVSPSITSMPKSRFLLDTSLPKKGLLSALLRPRSVSTRSLPRVLVSLSQFSLVKR